MKVSPVMKDAIWTYLEQYDLPVVVSPHVGSNAQAVSTQVQICIAFFMLHEIVGTHFN